MKYIARYPLLVAAIFFSLASGTLYLELKDLLPSGVLTVSVLDVGQGDAIFIERHKVIKYLLIAVQVHMS